jgi:EF-hand domain pair
MERGREDSMMRWPASRLAFASTLFLAGCDGRPLLYQLAPSETDQEVLAAYQLIDTANAGKLTRGQVDGYFKQRFAELDRNRDGLLDKDELRGAVPMLGMTSPVNMMFRLDINGDGKLSPEEFLKLSNYLFVRDENNDGVLTLTEVKTPPATSFVPVGKQSPGFDAGNPAGPKG